MSIILCHTIPCSLPHTPMRTKSQLKKNKNLYNFIQHYILRQARSGCEVHISQAPSENAESLLSMLKGDSHKSFIKNSDSQFPPFWGFMETESPIFKIDYLHITKASQHVSFECDASQKKYRFLHFLIYFLRCNKEILVLYT